MTGSAEDTDASSVVSQASAFRGGLPSYTSGFASSANIFGSGASSLCHSQLSGRNDGLCLEDVLGSLNDRGSESYTDVSAEASQISYPRGSPACLSHVSGRNDGQCGEFDDLLSDLDFDCGSDSSDADVSSEASQISTRRGSPACHSHVSGHNDGQFGEFVDDLLSDLDFDCGSDSSDTDVSSEASQISSFRGDLSPYTGGLETGTNVHGILPNDW